MKNACVFVITTYEIKCFDTLDFVNKLRKHITEINAVPDGYQFIFIAFLSLFVCLHLHTNVQVVNN